MTEFSGALRERISIEQRSEARDMLAGTQGKWRYDGAAWASLIPLQSAEYVSGDTISALPRWRVTMRKREGVSVASRLVWRGRYLRVQSVASDPREPAQMILTAEEAR